MDYGEAESKKIQAKSKKEAHKSVSLLSYISLYTYMFMPCMAEGKEVASKLHQDVQDLIKLMFNVNEFEACVKEMQFDVKKAPLGKLTKTQIKVNT